MASALLEIVVAVKDTATSQLGGIGSAIGSIITPATAAVGAIAAIGAATGTAVKMAGDFEATLNKFGAVAGDSISKAGLSMSDFSALALKMGAETQFSAQQAADAMVELAKGGIDPATIKAEALEATLALAAAGQLDLAEAANITAKQLGVWADTGVKAADVANLMAQAANASTVDVDELALGMANVGGVAKVAGLSFAETTQAMALLAPGFSSAADAGTSFKAFLNNLVPTSKRAIEASHDLGLITLDTARAMDFLKFKGYDVANMTGGEMQAALNKLAGTMGMTAKEQEKWLSQFDKSVFYDAKGNFVGMEEAARLLNDATKDLTQEQKAMALETIFGSDAQRAAAIIAEKGTDGYKAMGEAMKNAGTASEQAAKMNQGLNFAIESLKGSLETIGIVIGMMIIPYITSFINDAVIPAANAVLAFAQSLASGSADIGVFAGAFEWISSAVQDVVDRLSQGDISGAINVLAYDIATAFGMTKEEAGAMADRLSAAFDAIVQTAGEVIAFVVANWPAFRDAVVRVIQDIVAFVMANWPTVRDTIVTVVQTIASIVGTVLGIILTFWQENGASIMSFAGSTWESIKQIITLAINLISAVITQVFGAIKLFLDTHGTEIQAVMNLAWTAIKTIVETAINLIKGILTVAYGLIKGDTNTAMEGVRLIFDTVWGKIKQAVSLAIDNVKTVVANALGLTRADVDTKLNAILALFRTIWAGVVAAVNEKVEAARSAASALVGALRGAIEGGMGAVRNAIIAPIESAISTVRGLIDGLWKSFNSLKDAVARFILPTWTPPPTSAPTRSTSSFGSSAGSSGAVYMGAPITINIDMRGRDARDTSGIRSAVRDALGAAGQRADIRIRTA